MPSCLPCCHNSLCGGSPSKREAEHDVEDEAYEQNRTWLVVALQLFYLVFLTALALPYVFAWSAHRDDPRWLPSRIFLIITAFVSLCMCGIYFKRRKVRPMGYTLVVYAVLSPYVSWACCRQYMATPADCWLWLTLGTVLMLLVFSTRTACWLLALQVVTPAFGAIVDIYSGFGLDVHSFLQRTLNLVLPNFIIFLLLLFFSQVLEYNKKQALLRHELGQSILRNILPAPIADKLMDDLAFSAKIHIAQNFPMVTVCFCDIVGFTSLCLHTSPIDLVDTLNAIFTYFDRLCLLYGVEKIKTIGDAYLFVGFPAPGELPNEAAVSVIRVAVLMIQHMRDFQMTGNQLEIRCGANSGPVVAGVIGCTKFAYDIWGPTVNLASRLESSGLPNEIQVSTDTKHLISDTIPCTFRAKLPLKGAGEHDVYIVNKDTMPQTMETPLQLERLGLSDIATLVQEINSRQKRYIFAPPPGSSVAPILITQGGGCGTPHGSQIMIGRHSPRAQTIDRGDLNVVGVAEARDSSPEFTDTVAARANRILMLSHQVMNEDATSSSSPLRTTTLMTMPSVALPQPSVVLATPKVAPQSVHPLQDLHQLSWIPELPPLGTRRRDMADKAATPDTHPAPRPEMPEQLRLEDLERGEGTAGTEPLEPAVIHPPNANDHTTGSDDTSASNVQDFLSALPSMPAIVDAGPADSAEGGRLDASAPLDPLPTSLSTPTIAGLLPTSAGDWGSGAPLLDSGVMLRGPHGPQRPSLEDSSGALAASLQCLSRAPSLRRQASRGASFRAARSGVFGGAPASPKNRNRKFMSPRMLSPSRRAATARNLFSPSKLRDRGQVPMLTLSPTSVDARAEREEELERERSEIVMSTRVREKGKEKEVERRGRERPPGEPRHTPEPACNSASPRMKPRMPLTQSFSPSPLKRSPVLSPKPPSQHPSPSNPRHRRATGEPQDLEKDAEWREKLIPPFMRKGSMLRRQMMGSPARMDASPLLRQLETRVTDWHATVMATVRSNPADDQGSPNVPVERRC
eukprot:EG_transcript_1454